MGFFSFFSRKKQGLKDELNPESKWKVEIDGATIRSIDYRGSVTTVEISGIE